MVELFFDYIWKKIEILASVGFVWQDFGNVESPLGQVE
jgi:hypothetical protein